ncbi:MAG: DNA gyrase inhibitor YacG [Planctomycetota bacterium]|nr:DNA gyrase inhibitor YacG [Planctomycetota bacterium]MDA1139974.1 DNA gyrase inhibitor YacG [Planctomycetota bacterium]
MKDSAPNVVDCPICSREICFKRFTDAPYFPFCSRKCKLVDLGRWFNEEYSLDRELEVSDFEEPDFEDS